MCRKRRCKWKEETGEPRGRGEEREGRQRRSQMEYIVEIKGEKSSDQVREGREGKRMDVERTEKVRERG